MFGGLTSLKTAVSHLLQLFFVFQAELHHLHKQLWEICETVFKKLKTLLRKIFILM